MSILAMLAPIVLALLILGVGGMPTGLEAAAGASITALAACLCVAVVFFRRWRLIRYVPRVTEADRILPWMLLTMTVVALCMAVLLFYRGGSFFALAIPSEPWVRWFQENRGVGVVITFFLATAMIAKLRYPLDKELGRFWPAVCVTAAVVVFFAIAYLPRAF